MPPFSGQINFYNGSAETVAPGVTRQILGYLSSLMLVKVTFDKDSVGEPHQHPHDQVTYIMRGSFEVEINGHKEVLNQGDSFVVPGGTKHGVVCLASGILLDAFSPMRDEFIAK